ncbi:MAG: threonine/serine dehydratase [Gemmatimonadaceae bacterium]|nr:threonine/serine dehydratase [Gemmatimonadaceae bacterium]
MCRLVSQRAKFHARAADAESRRGLHRFHEDAPARSAALTTAPVTLPISIADVRAASERLAPFLAPTPLYTYPLLDAWVGHEVRVFVKHENFHPTNAFKVRNGLAFMSALAEPQRACGVVAATRGNHGLGIAWAARAFGAKATICVPVGNNPDKNAGIRALGARLIEEGRDYDESVEVARRIIDAEGATLAHSTNNADIVAGAATLSLEVVGQQPGLDAMVIAVGGGSQAVGALTVAAELEPGMRVFGVQAQGASAAHDSWHARERRTTSRAETIADGLATRTTYDLTFPALLAGLAGFELVSDAEIADAMRALLRTTHSLVEPAGAAGLAGLRRLAPTLAGRKVAIVISGGNVDEATLRQVLERAI